MSFGKRNNGSTANKYGCPTGVFVRLTLTEADAIAAEKAFSKMVKVHKDLEIVHRLLRQTAYNIKSFGEHDGD